jgi:hypothetical protein
MKRTFLFRTGTSRFSPSFSVSSAATLTSAIALSLRKLQRSKMCDSRKQEVQKIPKTNPAVFDRHRNKIAEPEGSAHTMSSFWWS